MNYNALKFNTEPSIAIDEIVKCYICLGKIQDACMCPNCQKLTCQKCLQKWIIEKKNQCPHCRNPLRLSQYIDNMSVKMKKEALEMCPSHSIQFLYYCIDCKTPLCSDCFMLEENHKSHSIKKLKTIYEDHCLNIKKEEELLSIQCIGLNKYLKDISDKIIEIGNFKSKKSQELTETFESLKTNLDNNIHEILSKLTSKKDNITEKLGILEIKKKEIDKKIIESSQSDLIKNSNEIIGNTRNLITKSGCDDYLRDSYKLDLSTEVQSNFIPSYESSTFRIDDYNNLVRSREFEPIYSPEIRFNGLVWRLKVYPCGNKGSDNDYLSVFIELIEGSNGSNQDPSKYFYKIELVNYDNPKKNFFQEHSSDFAQGDCWGYSRFFKIERIDREGFIDKLNKRLTFNFYVRAETYSQVCRDLKSYIKRLENKDANIDEILPYMNQNLKLDNKNSKKDNFNLLSDESIHANDPLSKSLNIDSQSNIKIATGLYNYKLDNNHLKQEDLKEPSPQKKPHRNEIKGIMQPYIHTIDSDPTFSLNKLSKINISPIRDKKKEKLNNGGKLTDQVINPKQFPNDLSIDLQNEESFKDVNTFMISKIAQSDSFKEDSFGFLMESLKGKEEKEAYKNINDNKRSYRIKQEDKKILNGQGGNPFPINNPFPQNNYGDYSNGRYDPFFNYANKNSQYINNDLFKHIFDQKR